MFKKLIILSLSLFLTSCIYPVGKHNTGGRGNIFGAQHYKYKCEKAGECCEVGKNCESETKN